MVSDVAGILRKLAPWTAIKSYIAIRAVFDYAAAALEPHGVTINNPADPRRLRPAGWSIRSRNDSKSHAAVDWRIAPSVVAELSRMDGPAAACMLFIAATGVRSKTARLAKWSDINLEARAWTPPFADLKEKHHKRPFVVPLNDVAINALERVSKSSRFVFGLLTESLLTSFLNQLRRRHPDWLDSETLKPVTVHGFRSTFRTWVAEKHSADSPLAELCLGHKVHGEVAGRYIRTGLIGERRGLLDLWSRHLRGESAKIIPIRSTR